MMNEWILFVDKKPPVDSWFIGYGDDVEFILIDKQGDIFVWEGSRVPYFGSDVTHWMPLPAPPEQDND